MPFYGYADFSVRRAGLGNLLIMWAKCEIFCRDRGCPMLSPVWTMPKIGPMLRREKDLRYYTGIFQNRPGYMTGLRRHWLAWRAPKVDSDSVTEEQLKQFTQDRSATLIHFWDYKNLLIPLIPEREFVSKQLHAILSPTTRQLVDSQPPGKFIALHVRRGDKPTLKPGEPIPAHPGWALPDEWFMRVVETARESLGESVPVRVFSDARPEELSRLLAMPNTTLAGTNNAMADILLLSKASALVTSGTSTFSMWAAYLGGMPTLWFPSLLVSLNGRTPWYDMETDAHGNVPDKFVHAFSDFTNAAGR